MKKKLAISISFILLISCGSLFAVEQLMTKLYFDNWLKSTTAPLENQIEGLKISFEQMEKDIAKLKSQLFTEIKVTIGNNTAGIDGKSVKLDVPPVIINGRTMVPVRFIGEAFGARFEWDGNVRKVTYILDNTTIELYIDKKTAIVNSKNTTLDVEPVIRNGRTMVPLRFLSQHMGALVDWDQESQTAIINK